MSARTLIRLAGIAAVATAAFTAGYLQGHREEHVDVPQPGEPALWAAGRLRAAGFARVRVVALGQNGEQQ